MFLPAIHSCWLNVSIIPLPLHACFSKVCMHGVGGKVNLCLALSQKQQGVLSVRQWSWPLPLPVQFFGIFPTGGIITEDDQELPWSHELEHKVFISAIGDCCMPSFTPTRYPCHSPFLPTLNWPPDFTHFCCSAVITLPSCGSPHSSQALTH